MIDQFNIDLQNQKYLEDHRFNGVVVAPGALLCAQLLSKDGMLSQVHFNSMIPLSETSTTTVKIVTHDDSISLTDESGTAEYAHAVVSSPAVDFPAIPILVGESELIQGDWLYEKFRQNGNDYGPSFRAVQEIKVTDGLGEIVWEVDPEFSDNKKLIILIDNLTHVIGGMAKVGTQYFLKSIDNLIKVNDAKLPAKATINAEISEGDDNILIGNFDVIDASGQPILLARGVRIQTVGAVESQEAVSVVGTFTLDPFIDNFQMWSNKLGINITPNLGDYGQVFQTLIQADGVFNGSSETNVCLVRLEDWMPEEPKPRIPTEDILDKHIGDLSRASLADGRVIAQLNKYETEYLYREIVIDKAYKRYDTVIQDNDTVLDIGANIGMFTMFAAQQANNVRIIAIEPSPTVLPILRANAAMYAPNSVVIGAGASDKKSEAEFTAYKKSSVFSSFSANEDDDHDAIAQIIRNTLIASGYKDEELIEQAVEELMVDRVESDKFICPLVSVSDVIDENKLTQIGLLKIDAEKSEEAILAGIRDDHWPIIEQVIIEVHKQSGFGVEGVLELFKKHGFICTEDEEQLLEDSGLVTLYAVRPERSVSNQALLPVNKIIETTDLFNQAVETYTQRQNKPISIVLCPPTTRDPTILRALKEIEQTMLDKYSGSSIVSAATWEEMAANYPVESVSDDVTNELGHIPYTQQWYAATSTAIIRSHLARKRAPYKVIALDCDNTLWGGVVGEEGADNVALTENFLALQHFVRSQIDGGKIVCLVSKNDEADVQAVFDSRSKEMALAWNDISGHRINWERKSQNLRELASELNLGLDSFIFLDDSPVECGEVRAACPEVLTIQLPSPEVDYKQFLEHIWSFDTVGVTETDKARTELYQREKERNQFRSTVSSFEDFLAGLALEIQIEPVTANELPRASQMTLRTNQFNFSTKRRSEADIQELLDEGYLCEYINVSDRFGDHGITGLIIYVVKEDKLLVDTFLLSCRVLGRGVEYEVVRHVGKKAVEAGVDHVHFEFETSPKNEPAKKFLDAIVSASAGTSASESVNAAALATVEFKPDSVSDNEGDSSDESANDQAQSSGAITAPSALIENIALTLYSPDLIADLSAEKIIVPRPELEVPFVAPKSEQEIAFATVWQNLLGIEKVGVKDNFFDLGGTSLTAVQLVAELRSQADTKVTIVHLFESPTVSGLCNAVSNLNADDTELNATKLQGKQRRQARVRRTSRAR